MTTTAIILAAGRGTKLWPYGETWAKAALPIANYPLIVWQVEALQAAGLDQIVVVTGPLEGQVRDALAEIEGVVYVSQPAPKGTADALRLALDVIEDETFLVLYGDVLLGIDAVPSLLDAAEQGVPAALVKPVQGTECLEWLCANVKDEQVSEIYGHPREASHQLCGAYILDRAIVPFLANNAGWMTSVEVGGMPPREAELAESLSQYLRTGEPLCAVEWTGLFADIDKPWHWLDANTALLNDMALRLEENSLADDAVIAEGAEIDGFVVMGAGSFIGHDVKIKGNVWIGENTRIIDGAIIGANCSIGNHAIIREYCRIEANSSIGSRCVVGHGAEFGGLMLDGAFFFHYGEYWGILGRSCDLGAATVCGNLRFDDQRTIHRIRGRREMPATDSANAVYMGDFTRTGVNAILMPGVKVGTYSIVGPGVILNEDLPSGTLLHQTQSLETRPWGPEKYGW